MIISHIHAVGERWCFGTVGGDHRHRDGKEVQEKINNKNPQPFPSTTTGMLADFRIASI